MYSIAAAQEYLKKDIRLGLRDTCPAQRLCGEIIRHLAPIQMEEKAEEEYFAKEEQKAVMTECRM